ncbi:unnamed protein product [marine sediment metagenome]|uniref:Uncharacterized protein n=1 Tax=marine sediment metagenome TaxID=412755 RepID=X1T4G3_9ZZZZ
MLTGAALPVGFRGVSLLTRANVHHLQTIKNGGEIAGTLPQVLDDDRYLGNALIGVFSPLYRSQPVLDVPAVCREVAVGEFIIATRFVGSYPAESILCAAYVDGVEPMLENR